MDGNSRSELSRRDFLKFSVRGLAGLFFGYFLGKNLSNPPERVAPREIPETERPNTFWENNRFFEDISLLTPEVCLQIEKGLLGFRTGYLGYLKNNSPGKDKNTVAPILDETEWKNTVADTVGLLRRVSDASMSLKKRGLLDEETKIYIENDVYDPAAAVWVILRSEERLREDPHLYREIVNDTKGNGMTDPVMGDEIHDIYTVINQEFIDSTQKHSTALGELTFGGKLGAIVRNAFRDTHATFVFSKFVDTGHKTDLDKHDRPNKVVINNQEHPKATALIEDTLAEFDFDRISPALTLSEVEEGWGGEFRPKTRNINLKLADTSDEALYAHVNVIRGLTVHEAAHALQWLFKRLPKDEDIGLIFHDMEKVLKKVRPKSLKDIFQPGDKCVSLLPDGANGMDFYDIKHATASVTNMTDYPVRYNVMSAFGFFKEVLQANTTRDGKIYPHIFRFLDENIEILHKDTFEQDFERSIVKWKAACAAGTASQLEQAVFAEIGNRGAAFFKASERSFFTDYENTRTMGDYLIEIVVPAIEVELYKKDPHAFEKMLVEDVPSGEKESTIYNVRNGYHAFKLREHNYFDKELFSEVLNFVLRLNDPGMENRLPDDLVSESMAVYKKMIGLCMENGLAMNPNIIVPA